MKYYNMSIVRQGRNMKTKHVNMSSQKLMVCEIYIKKIFKIEIKILFYILMLNYNTHTGLIWQSTWSHLRELHAAVKQSEEPLLSGSYSNYSFGEQQEVKFCAE
jgi:hypothetical protein